MGNKTQNLVSSKYLQIIKKFLIKKFKKMK